MTTPNCASWSTTSAGGRSTPGSVSAGCPTRSTTHLWRNLEETGLSRLTSTPTSAQVRPRSAIVLGGLARHAAAVPIAETDLLAAWLAAEAGLDVPATGPLTVAIADAESPTAGSRARRRRAVAGALRPVAAGRAHRRRDCTSACWTPRPDVADGHNLAGEPRGPSRSTSPADDVRPPAPRVGDELVRRGAWARCVQIVGAFDAAAELTVAHTRERVQFGRPLEQVPGGAALAGRDGRRDRTSPRGSGIWRSPQPPTTASTAPRPTTRSRSPRSRSAEPSARSPPSRTSCTARSA